MNRSSIHKGCIYTLFITTGFFLLSWVYNNLLVSILLSLFFSYVLNPIVNRFDDYKVPRSILSIVLLIFTFSFAALLIIKLLPPIYLEIVRVGKMVPSTIDIISSVWVPSIENYLSAYGFIRTGELQESFNNFNLKSQISSNIYQALNTLWKTLPKVIGSFMNIILVPFLTYFIINHYYFLSGLMKKSVPLNLRKPFGRVLSKVNCSLQAVIKGQILVACFMGTLYIIGFYLIGLQSAFIIGVVSGLCRIVPYLDIIIGGTLSLIIAIYHFSDWTQILSIVALFITIQSIDGLLLTPKILGGRVGLHPVVVILSILAFGNFFGFWGVVLAVPSIAVIKVLIEILYPLYVKSNFYQSS